MHRDHLVLRQLGGTYSHAPTLESPRYMRDNASRVPSYRIYAGRANKLPIMA